MRELTRIMDHQGEFPAVEQFIQLASDVKHTLPESQIGYAADWSEYSAYQVPGGDEVRFHLDKLWAQDCIDFVGIDNYMPLADWRDGLDHKDGNWRSDHALDYLQHNIEGGEGFDWFYETPEARTVQRRRPILDHEYLEPWVFRFKDVRSWWSKRHFDRVDGVRAVVPTAWEPRSKPIRFTEYGCAAIDKGANQPNKFLNEKSSESSLPHFSSGRRDDGIQTQYTRALLFYWNEKGRNPVSDVYDGTMIDLSRSAAWAWDARPWPYFPELDGQWSDGRNYARGHRLNGRTGGQPLSLVVQEICASAGLPHVDVSKVDGIVRGYVMSDVQTARADLQALVISYGLEVKEVGGHLCFSMRADAPTAEGEKLKLVRKGDEVLTYVRGGDALGYGRVAVHHVDSNGDFQARVSDARSESGPAFPLSQTELPLALTSAEGHALAARLLAESRVAMDQMSFVLPPSQRDACAGDLVKIKDEDDLWMRTAVQKSATVAAG
ncbi:hypothetical protein JSE7799_00145 [Jannaschia seosinensis]|uniref:Uncharacterized protein n=2 Tax=Jannaschia seosinensis TaxID=313367 RepID=A0A0M7B6K2_9RHOB|nr:hypothetical protein JSE7799_00145 [Jannaschia seosinensis]